MTVYRKRTPSDPSKDKEVDGEIEKVNDDEWISESKITPLLYLPLDVPASPLFKNESEKNIIPQVSQTEREKESFFHLLMN